MKKLWCTLVIAFMTTALFAQHWAFYPKNQEAYFKYQTEDKTHIIKHVIDSVELQGRMVYFYNDTIIKKYDLESSMEVLREFYVHYSTLLPGKESLFAYYDWSGTTMNFYHFDFYSDIIEKGFEFKPSAHVGDSWETGSALISCTRADQGKVLGMPDSLKTFSIKYHDGSSSELLLSKTYGLVRFVPLDRLAPYNQKMSTTFYNELVGLNMDGQQIGYRMPDFIHYFSLNPGDVKFWYDFSIVADYTYGDMYRKDSIVNVNRNNDEVTYTYSRTIYDANFNQLGTEIVDEPYSRDRHGVILNGQDRSIQHATWEIKWEEYFWIDQICETISGIDTTTILDCMYPQIFLNYYGGVGRKVDAVNSYETYSTTVGLTYKTNYRGEEDDIGVTKPIPIESTLIGTKVQGKLTGTTQFIPTSAEIHSGRKFSVAPNPVKDILTVQLPSGVDHQIEIFDLSGLTLLSTNESSSIDVSTIKPGLYIVRALGADGTKYYSRFIKE